MSTAVSELYVPVPWGEIRGKVWGPKQGYPVLCLHGWADNCGSFNTLIPLLPKEYRYVAIDLPGHGHSSHHPPGVFYTMYSYVADVRRIVEALRMTKFSIIGHSMGAHIAGMFSALFPEMVDALILLDAKQFVITDVKQTAAKIRQGLDETIHFEKKMSEKKKVYTYEKAMERLLTAIPLSKESAQILLERGLLHVEGVGFVFSRDLRVNFKDIVRLSLEQGLEIQSKTRASVLVILAEEGYFEKTLASTLQHFQDGNYKYTTVPGDHHVHLNNPQVVAPIISSFLQTKARSSSAKL